MTMVRGELLEALIGLNDQQQQRVLEFITNLKSPHLQVKGEPVEALIAHVQQIAFPSEDLAEMARIIEEEFEQVRGDELDVPDFLA